MNAKKIFLNQFPLTTQKVYGGVLNEFEGFTGTSVENATKEDVLKYHDHIKDQSPATVARKIATLSSCFSYLIKFEIRTDNPATIIRRPKVNPIKGIAWLTRTEVRKLLLTANRDPRTLAIVWMGLHGLRVSEIVGLNVEHLSEGALRVTGKGDKTRFLALAQPAISALYSYLDGRTKGAMFLGSQGRLKSRRIEDIIGDITEESGRRIHPHALRHTLATSAIKSGNPTLVVQHFLGHQNSRTTERYVHLDHSDMQGLVDSTYAYLLEKPFSIVEGEKELAG